MQFLTKLISLLNQSVRIHSLETSVDVIRNDVSALKDELEDRKIPDGINWVIIIFLAATSLIVSAIIVVCIKMEGLERADFVGYLLPMFAAIIGGLGLYRKKYEIPLFFASVIILLIGLFSYMASKGLGVDILYMFVSLLALPFSAYLAYENSKLDLRYKSKFRKFLDYVYYLILMLSALVFLRYFIFVLPKEQDSPFINIVVCHIKTSKTITVSTSDKNITVPATNLTISTPSSGSMRSSPCATISYSSQ